MTHASLFSGIGGPEIAAAMLGWENLFHCEINPFGRQILEYWFPKSKSYEDITKTDFRKWQGKVDILTGGFPCQPFSYAGQRRGADDDRYLWPEMLRVIDEVRPAWVVGENVAGITTMVEPGEVSALGVQATLFGEGDGVHGYRYRQPFTIEQVCGDLESHGYAVQPVLVPACAVGAPHRRDRVFIVGHLTDTNGTRQSAPYKPSGRARQTMDGERSCQSFDGIGRPSATRLAPHPDSHRGSEVDEHMESELADGCGGYSADTSSERLEGSRGKRLQESQGVFDREAYIARFIGDTRSGRPDCCGERWQDFPSVSPVHRGNDGIPFDVDRLAIPFSKWRTESLKAYGNAIVPQVMYEIFRFIEIVEKGVEK